MPARVFSSSMDVLFPEFGANGDWDGLDGWTPLEGVAIAACDAKSQGEWFF
jgi:hypothetical protein